MTLLLHEKETIKKNSSSLYSCVWLRRRVVDKERRKLTRSDLTNGSGRKFTTTHCEYHDDDDGVPSISPSTSNGCPYIVAVSRNVATG